MTLAAILSAIHRLSLEERERLRAALEAAERTEPRRHSLLELEGLGRRAGGEEDAQAHVARLRSEWDT